MQARSQADSAGSIPVTRSPTKAQLRVLPLKLGHLRLRLDAPSCPLRAASVGWGQLLLRAHPVDSIQSVAIECCSKLVERLDSPVVPVRELVVSAPAHR